MSSTHAWLARTLIACVVLIPLASNATPVSGHVTDAGTGLPIANATVEIWEIFPDALFDNSTLTYPTGQYGMDVPSGNANFTVSASGYATQALNFVSVATDPVTQDFALVAARSITGTIRTAASGAALANANVTLLDAASKSTLAQTTSASDGTYSFSDLTPGQYAVCVLDPTDIYSDTCYDNVPVSADGTVNFTAITLNGSDKLSGIDITLAAGATLSGTLQDSYFGVPISNTQIEFTLYSPAGAQVATVTKNTDATGGFTLSGLAAGSYYLEAGAQFVGSNTNGAYTLRLYGGGDCAAPSGQSPSCPFATAEQISVPAGGVGGIDFGLFPGYVISGKVTDAVTGSGLANVTINVCDNLSGFLYAISASATTNANGNYTVGHAIGAHTYSAVVDAPGYLNVVWPDAVTAPSYSCLDAAIFGGSELDFNTPDEVLTGVNFPLQQGAAITGSTTASDFPGTPISAKVSLYSTDGQSTQLVSTISSHADGNFTTVGVAPGTYFLVAYYNNGADCQVYSGASCGGSWDPTDPSSVDFSGATQIVLSDPEQQQTGANLQLKAEIFGDGFD